jgi:hypothetical protein
MTGECCTWCNCPTPWESRYTVAEIRDAFNASKHPGWGEDYWGPDLLWEALRARADASTAPPQPTETVERCGPECSEMHRFTASCVQRASTVPPTPPAVSIFESLLDVYNEQSVAIYLRSPNSSLNGLRPIDVIAEGDHPLLERLRQFADSLAGGPRAAASAAPPVHQHGSWRAMKAARLGTGPCPVCESDDPSDIRWFTGEDGERKPCWSRFHADYAAGASTAPPAEPRIECRTCGHWEHRHAENGCAIVTGGIEPTESRLCPCEGFVPVTDDASTAPPAEFQLREVAETIRNFTRRDKPPRPPGFTAGEWTRHCDVIAATAETFQAALIRGYDKWAAAASTAPPPPADHIAILDVSPPVSVTDDYLSGAASAAPPGSAE